MLTGRSSFRRYVTRVVKCRQYAVPGEGQPDIFLLTSLGEEWVRRAKAEHEPRSGEPIEIGEVGGLAATASAHFFPCKPCTKADRLLHVQNVKLNNLAYVLHVKNVRSTCAERPLHRMGMHCSLPRKCSVKSVS